MKWKFIIFILGLLIFLSACFRKEQLKNAAIKPLPSGFYDLPPLPREWNAQNLIPFGNVCEKFDVVGLGEEHHTSDGFYRAKVALIKYLIAEKGFRALAFEESWNSTELINNYLLLMCNKHNLKK